MSVAEVFSGELRKKTFLWGVEGSRQFADFCNARDYATWVFWNGAYALAPSTDAAQRAWLGGADVLRVSTRPFETEIPLTARTKTGEKIEISVQTLATASETESFWRAWGNQVRACGDLLESAIAQRIVQAAFLVVDEIQDYTYDDLQRPNDALPNEWWTSQLQGAFVGLGLTLDRASVSYASPNVEKRRERALREAAEKERLDRVAEDARLEEERARAVERKKQIEHDASINAERRALELQKIQFEAEELEQKRALARKEFEAEALKRELEIANLRAKPERDAEERARQDALVESSRRANEELQAMRKSAEDANRTIAATNSAIAATLNELVVEFRRTRDEREDRTNPWNLGPEGLRNLEKLGVVPTKKFFSRYFRERASEPGAARVDVELIAGLTRTATDALPAVCSLKYADPTSMRFTAPIDGYVTILNLGTDGNCLLIVPNGSKANGTYAGVSPTAARVQRGREYVVPGGELYDHTLYEGGPDGLEVYVALITPEPLFEDYERYNLANPNSPFPLLTPERLAQVVRDFHASPKEKRAVGILEFVVYGTPQ